MDDATVIRRLSQVEPPAMEAARQRAVDALHERLRAPRYRPRRGGLHARGRRGALSARLAVALLAAGLALAGFALLTAPGKAFTSWLGGRIGFGQPGGHPSLQSLRHFAIKGSGAEGQPAYVLLRGPGPLGSHYEFVTYRTRSEPGRGWPAERCFELEVTGPRAAGLYGSGCGIPREGGGVTFGWSGGTARGGFGPGSRYWIASGRASTDVAAIELELNGRPVPVELRSVPAWLIERLGIPRPFKFYIGSVDHVAHGGVAKLTARDASGRVVARRRSLLPDPAVSEAAFCRMIKRAAAEGKATARNVRLTCRGVAGD